MQHTLGSSGSPPNSAPPLQPEHQRICPHAPVNFAEEEHQPSSVGPASVTHLGHLQNGIGIWCAPHEMTAAESGEDDRGIGLARNNRGRGPPWAASGPGPCGRQASRSPASHRAGSGVNPRLASRAPPSRRPEEAPPVAPPCQGSGTQRTRDQRDHRRTGSGDTRRKPRASGRK